MNRILPAAVTALLFMASAAQAVETAPAARGAGTTIVGEQEAPIGLNLTPWKDEHAAVMDRSPALLDSPEGLAGESGLRVHAESYNSVSAYQRERYRRKQ
jgi:hypothetical protein